MREKKPIMRRVFGISGVALIAAAVLLLLGWQWHVHTAGQQAADCVTALRAVMPAPQGAVPQPRQNNDMPMVSVDETDYVGILEMPDYGSALPVGASWGKSSAYPCRFDGSVYNRTLQIGATTQKGQYDFYRHISVGDKVCFTDTAGNRYAYAVAEIRYERHAHREVLKRGDGALTLFIKNVYDRQYLIVYCDVLGE